MVEVTCAETQVDLQIENKLLSASIGIVSVRCGSPKNQYSQPFKKKIGSGSHPSGSRLDCSGTQIW